MNSKNLKDHIVDNDILEKVSGGAGEDDTNPGNNNPSDPFSKPLAPLTAEYGGDEDPTPGHIVDVPYTPYYGKII